MHRHAARGLTEDGDVVRIAAKRCNVGLHPLQGGNLIRVRVVALDLVGMLAAQRGEREEAEATETVVERHQHNALLRERDP